MDAPFRPGQARMDHDEVYSMFVFKVEPCPQKNKHPWDSCDYCHPQENARRRDVRKYRYLAEACPDYKLHGFCALGNDCPFAHGVFEINLHPSKYRTQMCTEGQKCCRKKCFFAHSQAQLRHPDFSYGYRNAAEAELVKDRLLSKLNPSVGHTRTAGIQAPPLRRVSPIQVAPGTPPQVAPERLMHQDQVGSILEAFRGLPTSLPTQTCGSAAAEPNIALYDLPGWAPSSQKIPDTAAVDALPARGSPSLDLAATQFLHNRAALQSTSLPADGGPRISMKVRRELGLEPPVKPKAHIPAAMSSFSPAGGSLPSSTHLAALRSYLAGNSTSASLPAQPLMLQLQSQGGLKGGSLPHTINPLRVSSPVSNTGSFRVTSPSGMCMSVEDAMAQLGMNTSAEARSDLGMVASALNLLSRLGYSLASESSSPTFSDLGRHSGQSTPDAVLVGGTSPLGGFSQQLPAAATAAPGLAALGLSAGTGGGYNLFN